MPNDLVLSLIYKYLLQIKNIKPNNNYMCGYEYGKINFKMFDICYLFNLQKVLLQRTRGTNYLNFFLSSKTI